MKKIFITIILLIVVGGGYLYQTTKTSSSKVTQTTAVATKGTLVSSIATTGSITSGNTTNISTKASGTVTKVYVANGDIVKKGQKILQINLDGDGIERRSSAWQAYLKSQEEVVSATKAKNDLSIAIWKDKQAILDAEDAAQDLAGLNDSAKNQVLETVSQSKLAFDVTAAKFSHADSVIEAAKISQSAAYQDYMDVSGSIVAPAAGVVNNLTLTEGSTLIASSSQSTTTGSTYASSQIIGFIRAADSQYQAKVSLTEVDVPKVFAGQKVNITMDAHSDKSLTGKVLAVDVSGVTSSGVTSYPATILMDPTDLVIYPNMSVSATIITDVQSDVLLLPNSAISTNNGEQTVQIMIDGKPNTTNVVVGQTNGTKTIIVSGVKEGDTIVTGSSTSAKNSNTESPFSNMRNMGGPGF